MDTVEDLKRQLAMKEALIQSFIKTENDQYKHACVLSLNLKVLEARLEKKNKLIARYMEREKKLYRAICDFLDFGYTWEAAFAEKVHIKVLSKAQTKKGIP